MSKKLLVLAAASTMMLAACNSAAPSNDGAMMNSSSSAMAQDGVMVGGALMVREKNIVENASNANNVTTLVAAVKAAGLVNTLSAPGPFTVFAPTNDAFAKLPDGTVETLLKPENKDMLTKILTYHVVAGKLMAADLKDGMTLKTVEGADLKVKVQDGKVWINDAMVVIADVVSSNGVTHVIDTVVMPPKDDAMMMQSSSSADAMMKKDDAMMKN